MLHGNNDSVALYWEPESFEGAPSNKIRLKKKREFLMMSFEKDNGW